VSLEPDLLRQATEARDRLVELQRDVEQTRSNYHYLIRRLHAEGGTLREIAEALGFSHQRVHQIVEVPGTEPWELPAAFPPPLALRRKGRRAEKFRRFTERARQAVHIAQEVASDRRHDAVGTEHLLAGLLQVTDGGASRALVELGVTRDALRKQLPPQGESDPGEPIPFTPKAKQAFELALREALVLGHNHIGTEHLLLALIRLEDDAAAKILRELGIEAEAIRTKLAA
jgi:Clp amino terminal domain, pathogenicity island component